MAQYIAVRALSRNSAGVRVTGSAVHRVTVDATSGTFTLTVNGVATAAIAEDANSATVATALAALSNVDAADVTVSGNGPHIIQWKGQHAGKAVTLTAQDVDLAGGGDAVTVAVLSTGGSGKLSSTSSTIIDVDIAANRQALARHSAIGQYVVTAANGFVGTTALPANA